MSIYDELGIKSSTAVTARNIKMMFYGAPGTRKTETVLRNMPHVLLIDSEGNGVQCVDMPEIPEFLYAPTKDVTKATRMVRAAAESKLKFSSGSGVETAMIDSASVFWSVQQEVAGTLAGNRAARYGKSPEEAAATLKDWGLAKRPLKALYTAVNNSPIKFLVFICREKDLYKEDEHNKDKLEKIGFTWDGMKGLDYEMNLVLRFSYDANGKWQYEVKKVQGGLGKLFPIGKTGTKIDFPALSDYAAHLKPSEGAEENEGDVADRIAKDSETQPKKSQADLITFASQYGITAAQLGGILKTAGFSAYDATQHQAMEQAILDHVAQQ
jgi:hypothetical protein